MTHSDPALSRAPEGAHEPRSTGGEQSTADVAKGQAGEVASTASDAGKHVAGVAGEQASQVASEATQQVKDLVQQTRGELTEQAATQQKRVASGLRSLGEELRSMAQNSEQQGIATDLAKQAAERTQAVASWFEDREPGHVVDEVTRFARRRPGAFLAIAAGAGLLVGRLGRGLKAANDDSQEAGAEQGAGPGQGAPDTSYQGYAEPMPQGHQPGSGYQPAPGHQPAPGYRQPAPPPAYPSNPGYPPGPGYPPPPRPQGPGYPAGPGDEQAP